MISEVVGYDITNLMEIKRLLTQKIEHITY